MNQDETSIAALLTSYERALNDADTNAAIGLYASDGVFMPQHFPSSVGDEALRTAYDGIFHTIRLAVKFDIREIRVTGDDWAFARTNSSGISTALASGASNAEANQELFVLQKVAGDWKIARYCFSTTNPPR